MVYSLATKRQPWLLSTARLYCLPPLCFSKSLSSFAPRRRPPPDRRRRRRRHGPHRPPPPLLAATFSKPRRAPPQPSSPSAAPPRQGISITDRRAPPDVAPLPSSAESLFLSSNGQFALPGSCDVELRLWDFNTGITTCRFVGHTKDVLSVAFSVDTRLYSPTASLLSVSIAAVNYQPTAALLAMAAALLSRSYPYLASFQRGAMFVDCDFLYLADIKELIALIDDKYVIITNTPPRKPSRWMALSRRCTPARTGPPWCSTTAATPRTGRRTPSRPLAPRPAPSSTASPGSTTSRSVRSCSSRTSLSATTRSIPMTTGESCGCPGSSTGRCTRSSTEEEEESQKHNASIGKKMWTFFTP